MSFHSAVANLNAALSSGQKVGNLSMSGSSSRNSLETHGIRSSSGFDSGLSAVSSYIDQMLAIQNSNNAWSANEAAKLRNWQQIQNQKAMDFNMSEAQKNRDWQEMMSNTAHQREIKDLQAAGLNPVLSASGGNGAAVGSGATASGVTSSGAKGDTDTSASGAIANLVTSMWNYQNQMEMARMSARSNEAIAARNNATSQLIAEINGLYGNQRAEISGRYGLSGSQIAANASMTNAQVAALASILNMNTSTSSAKDIKQMDIDAQKAYQKAEHQYGYISQGRSQRHDRAMVGENYKYERYRQNNKAGSDLFNSVVSAISRIGAAYLMFGG